MKLKYQHIILYLSFAVSFFLLLLNRYTNLYINNSVVHFTLLFVAASTLVVTIGIHLFGLRQWKSIVLTFLIFFVLSFTKAFLTWGGDWKTQTILYANRNNPAVTIDFQMRGDRFAFGYKRRIIQRERVSLYLDCITDADTTKLNPLVWKRVGQEVNEMNFPGEYVNVPQNEKP